ncbi:hypothetical protein N5V81_27225 [Escherichia coli]|nr:hypothetical protein [Escherichia coli]
MKINFEKIVKRPHDSEELPERRQRNNKLNKPKRFGKIWRNHYDRKLPAYFWNVNDRQNDTAIKTITTNAPPLCGAFYFYPTNSAPGWPCKRQKGSYLCNRPL